MEIDEICDVLENGPNIFANEFKIILKDRNLKSIEEKL